MNFRMKKIILCLALVLSGGLLIGSYKFVIYLIENGQSFERHIVPGKPTIDIHIYGMADAGFSAYMVEGRKKKKIFDLLECYTPDFQETANPIARNYQDTTIQREGDKSGSPMFQILWSADTNRIGIAFKGYFVAAYDRTTGQKIQFSDYVKDMHLRDRDGAELWHDYKKCDADIEHFIK
jgi:hypothetical protein